MTADVDALDEMSAEPSGEGSPETGGNVAAQTMKSRSKWTQRLKAAWTAAAVAALVGAAGRAGAFEIATGSDDLVLRFDNSLRYNLAYRTDAQNNAILGNPNADDGDRNFDEGIVSNRLDVLSELDLSYGKSYGLRASAATWYDDRYRTRVGNDSTATSNHLENGQPALGLSSGADRFGGPNGELLDAFVFGRFTVGDVSTYLKFGRHTVYWGESLLLGGSTHGISYSQMPIDVAKGFAVPGTDVKELFRPLLSISATSQLTSSLSVAGQYFLQWEAYRFPEAGSYLSFSDALLEGGESIIAGPVRFTHRADVHPDGKKDWGLSARWTPMWLEGTVGVYYRRFSDKLPQTHLVPASLEYFFAYADSIDLVGVSVSKQILNVSVGAELSARRNMPLLSDAAVIAPGSALPAAGETFGARGDTFHGVLNFLGVLTRTPLWDAGAWTAELTWNRWDHVSQGAQVFKGRDGYDQIDRVSRDFVGFGGGFTPTWFQVLGGVDVSLPVTVSRGLSGNSAVLMGGNKGAGTYSIGVSADVRSRYRFDLRYSDFFGDFTTGPTGAATVSNGVFGLLKDRGTVAFTAKASY